MAVLNPDINVLDVSILIMEGLTYFTFLYCINISIVSYILRHITINALSSVSSSTYGNCYYGKEGTLDNIYVVYGIASDNVKTLKEEISSRILIALIALEVVISTIYMYILLNY